MEMILNELPDKVAHLFMVNEKFDCRKEVILKFCDSIQDVAQKYIADKNTQADTQVKHNEPLNRMEIFNYDPDDTDEPMLEDQSSKSDINVASTSRGRGRGRGRGKDVVSTGKITKRGRGRPRKKLTSIVEEDVDSESYDCLDQALKSSSIWSYDWSYVLAWIGVGWALISALLFSGAAVCLRGEGGGFGGAENQHMHYLMPVYPQKQQGYAYGYAYPTPYAYAQGGSQQYPPYNY